MLHVCPSSSPLHCHSVSRTRLAVQPLWWFRIFIKCLLPTGEFWFCQLCHFELSYLKNYLWRTCFKFFTAFNVTVLVYTFTFALEGCNEQFIIFWEIEVPDYLQKSKYHVCFYMAAKNNFEQDARLGKCIGGMIQLSNSTQHVLA